MHSELVDTLRCLTVHEESWLVVAADDVEDRHIMRGVLGCPVCHARYPIERGVADFSGGTRLPVVLEQDTVADDESTALKLAAMFDLTDPSGYVILVGAWARLAAALRQLVPVTVLVVNAPPDVAMGDGVSGVATIDRIPVAAGSARAIAFDAPDAMLQEEIDPATALGAVKPGGRVVALAAVPIPQDISVLAQDAEHWVGTRSSSAPLIRLVRGGR
jgi:hypothetical protein